MATLLTFGFTNAVLASIVAAAVWLLTRWTRIPAVVHVLWLLVLVKLMTPPVVHLEAPRLAWFANNGNEFVSQDATNRAVAAPSAGAIEDVSPANTANGPPIDVRQVSEPAGFADARIADTPVGQFRAPSRESWLPWTQCLAALWLTGSGAIAVVATRRIGRFQRLLRTTSAAPAAIQTQAEALRARLRVRQPMEVRLADAATSPLVWPLGRQKVILLPTTLAERLGPQQLETVLAHELAHLKRGDHLVRWIELAALILYWWLPTTWWARRNLRQAEESACDAWVLSVLPQRTRAYASALIQAALLHARDLPPVPLVASGLSDGRRLVRRIEGLSHVRMPQMGRNRLVLIALAALLVLPTSLDILSSQAQDSPDPGPSSNEAEANVGGGKDAAETETARRNDAIHRGVGFLIEQQDAAGNWADLNIFNGGMTALGTLALLESGLLPTDEAVAQGLAWLRENDAPTKTYVVSLVARAYARAGLPEDRGRIKRNADWLGSVMIADGEFKGSWGYQEGSPQGDHSNSHYAVLGLDAAEAAGIVVPVGVWHGAMEYWLRTQNGDGSWGYKPSVAGTGSMTASGVASLAIASSRLGELPPDEAMAVSTALDRAYDWLSRNYSVAGNPFPEANGVVHRWHYYYLAALTNAMRRTEQARLGDHDWRSEVTQLLLEQQGEDGSWVGDELEGNKMLATALAISALTNAVQRD